MVARRRARRRAPAVFVIGSGEGSGMAVEATGLGLRRDVTVQGLVGMAHFTSHFYLLTLPPLFPILSREFGVGYAALGLLVTVLNLATGVAQTPLGFLVDRLGAHRILIAGQATLAGAFLLAGLGSSYTALLGLMMLAGLGNAVFHPADYAILTASVAPRRLGRAYSLHTFSGHLGWSVAPVTVIGLAGSLGWRPALMVVGAAGLGCSLVLVLGRNLLRDAVAGARAGATGEAAPAPTAAVLLSAPILTMFAFYVVTAAANGGLQSFVVTALAALHGTALATANMALTGFLTAGAVGVLLGGVIADRTHRHELVASAAMLCAALLILIMGLAALPALALIAVFSVAGLTQGVVRPARDMVVRAITPVGASGKVFGFVSTGINLGAAGSPLLFGWILDQGGARWLFVLVPAFLLAATAAVLAARWRHRD